MDLARTWLTDPIALLFLVTLFFFLRRLIKRPSFSTLLAMLSWAALVLLISAPKVVNPLLASLEDKHAFDPQCQASTIVVLGGGISGRISDKSEFQAMHHATFSRATSAWQFANRHPEIPVVAAGGAVSTVSEAEVMGEYLVSLGLNDERLLLESQSKNTRQNAENVAELLRLKDLPETVWLITSAAHRPRAKAACDKQGMSVCVVPVNYLAIKSLPNIAWMPQTTSLVKFKRWLHETLALVLT